ncbi:MAG: hypothetical protein AAGF99_03545 [Bacteroidota bacterium]
MLLAPLPPSARLWTFVADRPVTQTDADVLLGSLKPFLSAWTSHGRPVPAASALVHDRFLLVGAHIEENAPNAGVSGCGIDAMRHAVDSAAARLDIAWADGLHVVYEQPTGAVQVVPRRVFRALVREGAVDGTTPVFVTTLETVGALRTDGLRRRASETWHARVFRLAVTA